MTGKQRDKYSIVFACRLFNKDADKIRNKKLNPYEKKCIGESERLQAVLEKKGITFTQFVRISLKKMEAEDND